MFVRSWRALAGLLALTFLAMIGPWAAAACASPRPGPPSSPAHAYDASAYGYDSPSRLFREHRAASVREAPVPGRSLVAARPAAAAWGASNLISGFVVAAKAAEAGGIVYGRTALSGAKPYVGQAKSEARYILRQSEHARANPTEDFEFSVMGRAQPGQQLDRMEEFFIRQGGGPTNKSKPNGGLANIRHQLSDLRYLDAGGDLP